MGSDRTATCIRSDCSKSVYVEENGFVHPYCGKTCASIHIAKAGKCSNSHCSKAKYVEADGKVYDYCGRTCAKIQTKCARNGCNRGRYTAPDDKRNFYFFCSPACYWAETENLTSTKITPLSPNNLDYIRIHQNFISALPQAKIQGILLLQMPKTIVHAHNALKKEMPASGNVLHKMYHGTKSICDPGNLITRKEPSCASGCGVCGIIREGNNNSYSRHGPNMWFGGNPSVSNGYTGGNVNKAIFCVDVISNSAPAGFIIVSSNQLTLPRFLVVYQ